MQTVYTRFENLERLSDVYDLLTPVFYNNNFYKFVDNVWEPYFPREKELFCEINTKKIYIYKNCILKLRYDDKTKCDNIRNNICDNKDLIQNIYINLQSQIDDLNSCSTSNDKFFQSLLSWKQLGQDIDGEAASDESGYSVSLNSAGNIVAIGAPFNDGNGNDSGHCRVYKFDGTNWVQLGLDIDGEAANDVSGYSVSLNSIGDIVAIGAILNSNINGNFSGHCKIYKFNGIIWNQIGQDIDGEAANDLSGVSVSLNSIGNTVAIGAYENGDNGDDSGHCRVYKFNGSNWVKFGQDIDGEAAGDFSGYSVSLNSIGNIVAIGAFRNDGNGINSGHCRVYKFNGLFWVKLGQDIDGEAMINYSGWSVSINSTGDIVAIGAKWNNGINGNYSGHCRVYKFDGLIWVQIGQDIDGEDGDDESGWSVSLNSIGNIIAIGAPYNNGNDFWSGHCRIYKFNCYTDKWEKIGLDIDGEASGDFSGWSVSLNSIGNTVAIGALYNKGNGNWPGQCRIYKLTI